MARFLEPSELHGRAGCVKFSRNGFNLRRSAPRSLPQASFRTPTASVGSYTVTENGMTSACFFTIDAKLTRCACAMLSSARKWPYVFICQGAAVFVSEPARDDRNVHARFDAASGEEISQIVMGDPGCADFVTRAIDGLLTFADTEYLCVQRLA